MTATAPTPSSSSLASAQSLRRRYGRLSPVRLGVYGLVSLGSHLLLLGLFRWAWQVQLATQPVGSSIGIDFVEVDLSDGSFDGQRPDASGGKLSAAQLNELIAQGELASGDAIANADSLERGQDAQLTAEAKASAERARAKDAQADSPQANSPQTDAPQTNGASEGEAFRSGLPDRPALPFPATPTAQPQPNRDASNNASNPPTNSGEASGDGPVASETGAIAEGSSDGGSVLSSPSSSETNRPASSTGTEASATGGEASDGSGGSGGNGANGSAGRPNDLPPNISAQPVSPDQTIQPGETDLPDPTQPDPTQPDPTQGDAGTADPPNDGGTNPGSGSGTSGDNAAGESPTPNNDTEESNTASDANGSDANGNDAVPRLGAHLDIDEARSRAENTTDVVTQLPRPLGDPLSNGSPSASGGRCAAQLASLMPMSYGQPVQLILAVDKTGEVFYAEALEPVQAQTPAGQAAICLARAWPFEPAKREIDEGGVNKIENAGAELVVTVTISLLD